MTAVLPPEELALEYDRLGALAAAEEGPGRTTTLGWDLEYVAPDALCAFVDQILFRRLNDFIPDTDRPVILDCGANIGFTSLHYKRQFPGARITAFEPDPQFAPLLRRNLSRNGGGDVEVVEAAAWTADGRASWVMEGKDGSRLLTGAPTGAPVVDVATVDLARYLDRDVDLLKLDIEGAEFDVVPHIAPRLHRVRNIVVECHITDQSRYRGLAALLAALTQAGFQIGLNSYGPWRDLIRRHVPAPLHAEQYLTLAGWRSDPPGIVREETYTPYVSLPDDAGRYRRRLEALQTHSALVGRVLSGLAADPAGWVRQPMTGPYRQEHGRCWTWPCPPGMPAGDAHAEDRTPTVLLEDDRVLGPGHALHADIRLLGGGRFSHWDGRIYFSTCDGSDPNTNGRRYTAIYPR